MAVFLPVTRIPLPLPNWARWEDSIRKTRSKSLILLVGAAGFEPTTCSTQNCRATRLRYTPICIGKCVDTRLNPGHQGDLQDDLQDNLKGSALAEERVRHPVAGLNSIFLRRTGDHFQHALGETA
jgi:hypothetical protein